MFVSYGPIHRGVEVTQVQSSVIDYGSDLCDLSHIHRLCEVGKRVSFARCGKYSQRTNVYQVRQAWKHVSACVADWKCDCPYYA